MQGHTGKVHAFASKRVNNWVSAVGRQQSLHVRHRPSDSLDPFFADIQAGNRSASQELPRLKQNRTTGCLVDLRPALPKVGIKYNFGSGSRRRSGTMTLATDSVLTTKLSEMPVSLLPKRLPPLTFALLRTRQSPAPSIQPRRNRRSVKNRYPFTTNNRLPSRLAAAVAQ